MLTVGDLHSQLKSLRHAAQMAQAFSQVQAVLGTDSPISDKQIRDALWDSYFDVDGSIAHLLGDAPLTSIPHVPRRWLIRITPPQQTSSTRRK